MNVRSSIRYTIGIGAVGICIAAGVAIVRRSIQAGEDSGSAAEIGRQAAAEQPSTVEAGDGKLVATSA